MDIDGHVEINGQHLIFETKDSGIAVPAGQRQALMQLWAKGYVTLVFLWGKTDPMKCEIFWPKGFKTTIGERKLTKEKLAEICESWARWAERTPCPFRYSDPNA
jgi:hypothetical protein